MVPEYSKLRDPILIEYLKRGKKILSRDDIENRISEVREVKFKPEF